MITRADFFLLDKTALLRNPFFDWFFSAFTHLGDGGMLWIAIALICLCLKKTRKTGLCMVFALALGFLIANLGLKPLVARQRPFQLKNVKILIAPPTDFSFPSGHTVSSFGAATALFKNNRKWGSVAFVVAGLIAFSRLYLYVHFPSDVICGILIGLLCGYSADKSTNKIYSCF